jgi:anti-sigma-K factor RskA
MSMSDDIDRGSEDRALAAEYVLGVLDASDHAAFAERLSREPALAAETRLWRRHFDNLNSQFAEVPAPARVWGQIETRLFGGASTGLAGIWNNLNLWRGFATAAFAVAIVAIGVNVMRPAPLDPRAFATQFVAALSEDGSDVKFVALYDGATGTVRLTALSGAAVPDKDFELWAIQGDAAPVSMGVIPVDARSQVTITPEILAKFGPGSVLAVTLEPKGGSPTGGPTGPIVAKGVATQI